MPDMTVSEIMITEVNQLPPDATLEQARSLMAEKSIRHIPIVDNTDRLIGLVTQRDILAAASSSDKNKAGGVSSSFLTTADIMRKKIFTVGENTNLRLAALTMQRHKIGSLLVVDNHRLVGIITDSDYVGLAINLLEQMEEFEPPELEEL